MKRRPPPPFTLCNCSACRTLRGWPRSIPPTSGQIRLASSDVGPGGASAGAPAQPGPTSVAAETTPVGVHATPGTAARSRTIRRASRSEHGGQRQPLSGDVA